MKWKSSLLSLSLFLIYRIVYLQSSISELSLPALFSGTFVLFLLGIGLGLKWGKR